MTTINKQTLQTLRPQVEQALAELGDRFGIDFALGRGSYNSSGVSGSFTLEMSTRDEATGKSGAQVIFERYAPRYGLTAEDFGREFSIRKTRYKIVGINPNAPVNCLTIARVRDDKEFVASVEIYTQARDAESGGLMKKAA
jgi:hypothetical protein